MGYFRQDVSCEPTRNVFYFIVCGSKSGCTKSTNTFPAVFEVVA